MALAEAALSHGEEERRSKWTGSMGANTVELPRQAEHFKAIHKLPKDQVVE